MLKAKLRIFLVVVAGVNHDFVFRHFGRPDVLFNFEFVVFDYLVACPHDVLRAAVIQVEQVCRVFAALDNEFAHHVERRFGRQVAGEFVLFPDRFVGDDAEFVVELVHAQVAQDAVTEAVEGAYGKTFGPFELAGKGTARVFFLALRFFLSCRMSAYSPWVSAVRIGRFSISLAAFLVNVMASMSSGLTPFSSIR